MDLNFKVLDSLVSIVYLLLKLITLSLVHRSSSFVDINLHFKQILDFVKASNDIILLLLKTSKLFL
jgi:hypothetical protein